jgi:hypothetical protein
MSLEVRVASIEETLAIQAGRIRHLETLEPAGGLKELWADVRPVNGSVWDFGAIVLDTPMEQAFFVFALPDDWKSTKEALIYIVPDSDDAIDWVVMTNGCACGEPIADGWCGFDGGLGEIFTQNELKCLDVTDAFTPIVGTQLPGDMVQLMFSPQAMTGGVQLYVYGLLYRYN